MQAAAIAAPSAPEQLMIELINRARLDPIAEAARHGIDLDDGLSVPLDPAPRAPLAPNAQLRDAAAGHAAWLIAVEQFSHEGEGDSQVGDRVAETGYPWRLVGENLALYGSTESLPSDQALIEIHHAGLFRSPGHRATMLSAAFVDVGVAQAFGPFNGYSTSVIVVNFGAGPEGARLTGVVFDDRDGDGTYGIGEGIGGVRVRAAGPDGVVETMTTDAGGYGLAVPTGTLSVSFDHPAHAFGPARTVEVMGDVVKLDAIARGPSDPPTDPAPVPTPEREALTSTATILADPVGGYLRVPTDVGPLLVLGGAGDDAIVALGTAGNRVDLSAGGNNRVLLGSGNDTVSGGAGNDVVLAGRGGDNFIDLSAGGDNRVTAGDGADTIIGGAGRDVIRPGRGDDFIDLRAGGDNFVFNLRGNATILGGAGDDVIRGGIGDTFINAGGGNNRLITGPGRDVVAFEAVAHETRILDFRPRSDRLDFTDHDGVGRLGDLTIRQIGANTVIDDTSGGRILLAGLQIDQIGDGDFIF